MMSTNFLLHFGEKIQNLLWKYFICYNIFLCTCNKTNFCDLPLTNIIISPLADHTLAYTLRPLFFQVCLKQQQKEKKKTRKESITYEPSSLPILAQYCIYCKYFQ